MPDGKKTGGRLRAGVVGVGHLGSAHARVYDELCKAGVEVELVAVCDTDGDKASRIAKKTGATPFTDYREMRDLDLVSVVVPTASHLEVASFFLEQGKSVLVEKPMALNAAEAETLLECASRSEGILQVGHIERFNPAVRAARAHVDRPRFIECRRVAPFSFRSTDIGVIFDLMIHDLDIVQWLVGAEPERVEALGTSVLLLRQTSHEGGPSGPAGSVGKPDEAGSSGTASARPGHGTIPSRPAQGHGGTASGELLEDIANARLVFPGKDGEPGCVANLTASRVAAKAERSIRIFQSSSYISVDTITPGARLMRPSAKLARGEIDVSRIRPTDVDDVREFVFSELLRIEHLPLPPESPLEAELKSFIGSARTGSEPGVSARDGLGAIRLAERVLEAIRRSEEA